MDFERLCQKEKRAEIHNIGNSTDKRVPEKLNGRLVALAEKKISYTAVEGVYRCIMS